MHIHKVHEEEELTAEKVGEINSDEDLQKLLVEEQFLRNTNDLYNNSHIKTSLKEEEDFVILPDKAWQYLFKIYGGTDIPRYSIEAERDEDTEEEQQYLVEVYLKKLYIYILPKIRNHLCLKKPSPIHISRRATIEQLKKKIAEILYENKKDISFKNLMSMSRIWRLDLGETVFDVEKIFEYETLSNLPMHIRGRILAMDEIISNINVADNDILLYEVQYNTDHLRENSGFAFTAKPKQQAKKASKNKHLNQLQ